MYVEGSHRYAFTLPVATMLITASPPPTAVLIDKGVYEAIENLPEVQATKQRIEREDGVNVSFPQRVISRTQFGAMFIEACVVGPNSK